jgi:hypothetical protein
MAKRQRSRRSRKQMRGGRKTARRSRRRTGGQPINLTNICITQPIIDAVNQHRPFDYKAEGFKMLPKGREPGYKLSRMDRMMSANINALVQTEPVQLIAIANHPKAGTLYEIVDGRHRFTRSIIDQLPTINATIL